MAVGYLPKEGEAKVQADPPREAALPLDAVRVKVTVSWVRRSHHI